MINDHPVIRKILATGYPDDRSAEEYHCPNPHCEAVAEIYYEFNGEIIGCEECVNIRYWYEVSKDD